MWEAFGVALASILHGSNLLYLLLGTLIGLIIGVLPGIGTVAGLSMVLPLTYGLDITGAMTLFAGIMGGSPFGGSITSILLNTPGNAGNAATCFDGYPMAKRGEGGKAIVISATSNLLGATISLIILVALIPLLRMIIFAFRPPEYFMIVLFGLATVALAARRSLIKGLFAGLAGILLSLIGYSNISGENRFTVGSNYLWDGVTLVPLLVGLFAVSEVMRLMLKGGTVATKETDFSWRGALSGFRETMKHKLVLFRSTVIGSIIGIVPGIGGSVAAFLAYTTAVQASKQPDTFGKGNPEGIIAPESANNAETPGALLPTIAFGIPGSAIMAVLLAGFTLHGMVVGPEMLKEHADVLWTLILGLLVANIVAVAIGVLASGQLAKLTTISVNYLSPVVLALCLVGTYAVRQNIWDVVVTFAAGFLGYGLVQFGFPIICVVIGYVLGSMAETAFHQSLMINYGSYSIFFTSPIALTLFLLTVSMLVYPYAKKYFARRKKADEGS